MNLQRLQFYITTAIVFDHTLIYASVGPVSTTPANDFSQRMSTGPDEIVIGARKIISLLAISPVTASGQIMCCADNDTIYFCSYVESPEVVEARPARVIYKTKMSGRIVAAKFHEHNFEVYLKIEKKSHRKGVDFIEEDKVVFDLESKNYRNCCAQDSVPDEPWPFPGIPKEVSKPRFLRLKIRFISSEMFGPGHVRRQTAEAERRDDHGHHRLSLLLSCDPLVCVEEIPHLGRIACAWHAH